MCTRGVKQGCPLSPILFNLAIEQLLQGLKVGYQFEELQLKVIAYDNNLCLVTSDRKGM